MYTDIIRWIIALAAILLSLAIAVSNWRIFFIQIKRKSPDARAPSFIPFIGGVLGAIGAFVCPLKVVSFFFWVPAILDFGSVPYLLIMGYVAILSAIRNLFKKV